MDPGVVVPLGAFLMIVSIVLGIPYMRAMSKKIDNESKVPRIPEEVVSRLERMEQSIDAIAVEVERISEGQRFTTKLLSDSKSGNPALSAGAKEQVPQSRG